MSTSSHVRTYVIGLMVLLLISVGYNGIWITASPAIMEMQCKAHFAEVKATAIASQQREDWNTAAHLYAYMMQFYPYSADHCKATDEEANWKLPLGALALKWRYRETPDETARTNELELDALRQAYTHAIGQTRPKGS